MVSVFVVMLAFASVLVTALWWYKALVLVVWVLVLVIVSAAKTAEAVVEAVSAL